MASARQWWDHDSQSTWFCVERQTMRRMSTATNQISCSCHCCFHLFALLHIKVRKGHRESRTHTKAVFPLAVLDDWASVWFLVSFVWDALIHLLRESLRLMVRFRHPLEGDNRVGKKWLRPVCLRSGGTIRRRELPGNLTSKRWTMTLGAFSPLSSCPILSQTSSTISRPLIKRRGTTQGATFLQMEEQGALRKWPGINFNISTRWILCLFSIFPQLCRSRLRVSDEVLHLQPSRGGKNRDNPDYVRN